jgi:hypothetical protein
VTALQLIKESIFKSFRQTDASSSSSSFLFRLQIKRNLPATLLSLLSEFLLLLLTAATADT